MKPIPSSSPVLGVGVLLILAGMAAIGLAGRLGLSSPPAAAAPVPLSYSRTDAAISTFQERLRRRPDDQRAYVSLGNLYLQKARESGDPAYYTKAEAVLRRGRELKGDDYQALASLGTLALARHRFREALDWGERARALNPYSTVPLAVIGDAQVELGRYEEGFAAFQEMDSLRPDLASFARVSYMRELQGDLPGAIAAMRRAVDAGGPHPENSAWTRVQLANLLFNSGDAAGAEREYRRTLVELPGFVPAQVGLARIAAGSGDYAAAIALLEPSVSAMPLPEYVILLGDIQRLAGQHEAADRQYALVGAMQQLFRANGVDTDLEIALFDLDHDQNLADALARAERVAADRPSIHALDTLAWALYKHGRYEEAAAASERALRLGTKDPLLLFHAGLIAEVRGDRAAARDFLSRAVGLNPHFSFLHMAEAQRRLAALEGGGS